MKKILIIFALLFSVIATAQQYHDKGAKFEFATNEGDTITVNTRIPIIDEFGLINYYVDVADLLALNPAPVLEWGNITGTLSNQTDLQGELNDKADQSALTAHTSNGNIHFTQSAISITESQVSDLKDYLRGDVNDTNGANKLTLGSLEVVGQTTLQNGLNLTSIPTGTSNNILTINGTGDVEQRVFSLGDIDIANAAGVNQFPVGLGDQLRIQGSGDTSISFDGVTNTININSVPGSGTGGAVTSFNGRTGGVVSQAGDYSTAMVNENTNLYFTEGRVRSTPLTGLSVSNTPISSTNTFIQALGRLQGQINDRYTQSQSDGRYAMMNNLSANNGQLTISTDDDHNKGLRLINNTTSQSSFFYMDNSDELNINNSTSSSRPVYINKGGSGGLKVGGDITGSNLSGTNTGDQTLSGLGGVPTSRTISAGAHLSGGGNLTANRTLALTLGVSSWITDSQGNDRMFFGSETDSGNGAVFKASNQGQQLQYRNVNGNSVFRVFDTGFISSNSGASFSGNVTADGFIGSGSQLTGLIKHNTSGINTSTGGALNTNDGQIYYHSPSNNNYGGTLPFAYGAVYQFQGSTTGRHFALGHSNNSTDFYLGSWDTNNNPSWNQIWHGGNKRSDSQNDNRYAIMNDTSQNLGQLTIRTDNSNSRGLRLLNNSTNQSSFLYMDDSNELNINNSGASSRTVYINKGGTGGMNVGGTITATGDVIANSDRRLKKNIKQIDNALAIVQLLGGYEYDRKDIDLHQAGVIAQEVEEVFPTAVSEDEKGIKSVAYNQLIALLIEAVKDQQIEIENLKTLINEK